MVLDAMGGEAPVIEDAYVAPRFWAGDIHNNGRENKTMTMQSKTFHEAVEDVLTNLGASHAILGARTLYQCDAKSVRFRGSRIWDVGKGRKGTQYEGRYYASAYTTNRAWFETLEGAVMWTLRKVAEDGARDVREAADRIERARGIVNRTGCLTHVAEVNGFPGTATALGGLPWVRFESGGSVQSLISYQRVIAEDGIYERAQDGTYVKVEV